MARPLPYLTASEGRMAGVSTRLALPMALALILIACGSARPPGAAPGGPGNSSAPNSQTAAPAAAAPAPISLKVADSLSGTLAGLYVGIEKGYFAEAGLDVETVRFPSLEPQIAPLGTNEIDVGQGGFVP